MAAAAIYLPNQMYQEHPNIAGLTNDEIAHFHRENQITLQGNDIPKPILSFNSINLPNFLKYSLQQEGYSKPTSIQSQAWPIVLKGRDMVGIAQTGSGKTLAYILPALLSFSNRNSYQSRGPKVLVLAPTRELAQQIHQVSCKFGGNQIRSVCIYGGAPKGEQIRQFRNGCDICIATPGRLIDFLNMNVISVTDCAFLVLDEADRMLDMGFEPQVRKIILQINSSCQTLMWSATWPKQVKSLAEEFLNNYIQINIGSISNNPTANHNISQIITVCSEHEKMSKLTELLGNIWHQHDKKTLIFAETKKKVEKLSRDLSAQGYPVLGIHGDKKQMDREWILNAFSRGEYPVMVATDVAGRGLDVDDIKYVVNFDYPNCAEDYIHRIGRTGRSGKTGTAFTLFTLKNARHAQELISVLQEANQQVDQKLMNLVSVGGRRFTNGRGGGGGGFRGGFNSYKENSGARRGFGAQPGFGRQTNQQQGYQSYPANYQSY